MSGRKARNEPQPKEPPQPLWDEDTQAQIEEYERLLWKRETGDDETEEF